jgi:hypothetical protein
MYTTAPDKTGIAPICTINQCKSSFSSQSAYLAHLASSVPTDAADDGTGSAQGHKIGDYFSANDTSRNLDALDTVQHIPSSPTHLMNVTQLPIIGCDPAHYPTTWVSRQATPAAQHNELPAYAHGWAPHPSTHTTSKVRVLIVLSGCKRCIRPNAGLEVRGI